MLERTEVTSPRAQGVLPWLWRWLPPLLWMAIIFYLSAQPDLPQAPDALLDVLLKKSGHAVEYASLFLLYLRAWKANHSTDRALRTSLWATGVYALSDELHQAFVPGRKANWYDVVIDMSGVLLLFWLLRSRRRNGFVRTQDQDLAE
jgi:VanZ family protein